MTKFLFLFATNYYFIVPAVTQIQGALGFFTELVVWGFLLLGVLGAFLVFFIFLLIGWGFFV